MGLSPGQRQSARDPQVNIAIRLRSTASTHRPVDTAFGDEVEMCVRVVRLAVSKGRVEAVRLASAAIR